MLVKIDEGHKELSVSIPLIKGKDKIRVKKRSILNEYGMPVATRSEKFSMQCYIEWQIGYDVVTSDAEKLKLTTLKDKIFIGANGKEKALYELSEYIYYFYKWNIIKKEELVAIINYFSNINNNYLLDVNSELSVERSHPIEKNILDIDFEYSQVKYPILIHKFQHYEIITEIMIREKQYAIGLQPMLYLCFPITELQSKTPLLGRCAEMKEEALFIVNKNNCKVFLEILKIFGILSNNHKEDVINIINTIMGE